MKISPSWGLRRLSLFTGLLCITRLIKACLFYRQKIWRWKTIVDWQSHHPEHMCKIDYSHCFRCPFVSCCHYFIQWVATRKTWGLATCFYWYISFFVLYKGFCWRKNSWQVCKFYYSLAKRPVLFVCIF